MKTTKTLVTLIAVLFMSVSPMSGQIRNSSEKPVQVSQKERLKCAGIERYFLEEMKSGSKMSGKEFLDHQDIKYFFLRQFGKEKYDLIQSIFSVRPGVNYNTVFTKSKREEGMYWFRVNSGDLVDSDYSLPTKSKYMYQFGLIFDKNKPYQPLSCYVSIGGAMIDVETDQFMISTAWESHMDTKLEVLRDLTGGAGYIISEWGPDLPADQFFGMGLQLKGYCPQNDREASRGFDAIIELCTQENTVLREITVPLDVSPWMEPAYTKHPYAFVLTDKTLKVIFKIFRDYNAFDLDNNYSIRIQVVTRDERDKSRKVSFVAADFGDIPDILLDKALRLSDMYTFKTEYTGPLNSIGRAYYK